MENRERIVKETEALLRSSLLKTRQPEEGYIRHVFSARNYAHHLADIFVYLMPALHINVSHPYELC